MKFTVIKVEERATPKGKRLKEVTLQGEGQDHLEPRTTIWEDHPEFDKAIVGGSIKGTLEKKDSGTPIPAHPEKNYIDRTLLPEVSETKTPSEGVAFLEDRVKRLEDAVFSKKEDTIEYPEGTGEPTI